MVRGHGSPARSLGSHVAVGPASSWICRPRAGLHSLLDPRARLESCGTERGRGEHLSARNLQRCVDAFFLSGMVIRAVHLRAENRKWDEQLFMIKVDDRAKPARNPSSDVVPVTPQPTFHPLSPSHLTPSPLQGGSSESFQNRDPSRAAFFFRPAK